MRTDHSDSILEVKLDRVASNFKHLCSSSGSAACSAVVKANAYGLGVGPIAEKLYETGCRNFFVATLDEAIELRYFLDKKAKIHVFHGVKSGEEGEFVKYDLIPVINDFYQLEIWSEHSKELGNKLPCIIHIDTGMNRLGISYERLDELEESGLMDKVDVRYMMSHLSCIIEEGHPLNRSQAEKMRIIKERFNIPCTLANSRGVIAGEEYHFDMVRPGSMLYGIKGNACHTKIQNVVTLKSKIIQLRKVESDSFVGYGAMAAVKKGERLAVVPVGYADGYQRILSNNSHGYIGKKKIPMVGRVSMDMVIFNISDIPENEVNIGDHIELLGESQRVDELAERANTIGYEIMTSLGDRYKRIYI